MSVNKDILLICKGHYDKEKYENLKEALDAYYRKMYAVSKESLPELSYEFMFNLWAKPCIKEFLIPEKIGEFYINVIAEESLQEKYDLSNGCLIKQSPTEFYEAMFCRFIKWMQNMRIKDGEGNWIIDLSEYDLSKDVI